MNRKIIYIIVGVVIVLVLGYSYFWMKSGFVDYKPQTQQPPSVFDKTTAHLPTTPTTTQPSDIEPASSSEMGASNWTTYRNKDFGFTFSYRFKNDDHADFVEPSVITTSSTVPVSYDPVAEQWWNIYLYPDPSKFHASVYNQEEGSSGVDLSYSPSTRQWIVNTELPQNTYFCPEERTIGSQSIPYYEVATGHHAGASIQLFVTKKGLIVFTGGPVGSFHWYTEENKIIFDEADSVLKATCTYASR